MDFNWSENTVLCFHCTRRAVYWITLLKRGSHLVKHPICSVHAAFLNIVLDPVESKRIHQ